MKLAIVYDPFCIKLKEDTYSYTFRGMLEAVAEKFNPFHIVKDCSAQSIKADVILFFDITSCHHIKIDGIEKHPALKLEYMSDPWQNDRVWRHKFKPNLFVRKLGAKQRLERTLRRGVKYIISPHKVGYFKYFTPFLGEERAENMLLFFPHAPCFNESHIGLSEREQRILANGAVVTIKGGYDFRQWAFKRPNVTYIPHFLVNDKVPKGKQYGSFLSQWAGGLALDDHHPIPKYSEMPMAGCVTFMQHYEECEEIGFKHYENCVYVNKDNFDEEVKSFLSDIPSYQKIASAGEKLMKENYTASHFAEFIYNKSEELRK